MPLGGRWNVWPPRCVFRSTAVYAKWVGRRNSALVEACLRELLRVLGVPVAVRPYNRSRPLNVTFYTNMNFVVSRRRIRYYTHTAWRALATRFIDEGVCLPQTVATAAPNRGAVAGAMACSGAPAGTCATAWRATNAQAIDAAIRVLACMRNSMVQKRKLSDPWMDCAQVSPNDSPCDDSKFALSSKVTSPKSGAPMYIRRQLTPRSTLDERFQSRSVRN